MHALLFDCDGVLVDTERDGHRIAFNKAFADTGLAINWSVERYGELLTTGGGKERMVRFFDEEGWPADRGSRQDLIAALHKRKTEAFTGMIESGAMPLRPGVARLVDEAIAAGVPLAVCSTSNERAVSAIVNRLLGPQRAKSVSIFAGDVVKAKKPDPAIYDLAARTLFVDPHLTVVIEDSSNGLRAAKAAAMNCIVTVSPYTAGEDFSLADLVVPDLDAGIDLSTCRALVARRVSKLAVRLP
jgi:HAD superfamily hydrolase (TIGR01509 family)